MTGLLIHDNPTIFPNPRTFAPDRWLQTSSTRLHKYLIPFSRGTRQCVGMKYVPLLFLFHFNARPALIRGTMYDSLAYAELYLTAAALFAPGRFDLTFFETTIEDVETAHDFFNPFPRQESKGIRMQIN